MWLYSARLWVYIQKGRDNMLFQIYGENAGYQLLGWLMVFVGLIVLNEVARRSKAGGFCALWRCPPH